MGTVEYKNRELRVITAFLTSVYMLIHGRPFDVQKALTSPGFYIVLAISFGVALLLVELVHLITTRLDKRYGWRSMFAERAVLQATFGIILPAIIDLAIIGIYFKAIGQDIFDNGYYRIDFPVVFSLLVILNFYYCIHYWMLTDKRNLARELELAMSANQQDRSVDKDMLLMEHKGQHIYFKTHDILYFYRSGKSVNFRTEDGQEYPINLTIGSLVERYGNTGFIRINRGMVINKRIVIGYRVGNRKNTLQLMINERYGEVISKLGTEQFQVTKEYISTFKDRLQA